MVEHTLDTLMEAEITLDKETVFCEDIQRISRVSIYHLSQIQYSMSSYKNEWTRKTAIILRMSFLSFSFIYSTRKLVLEYNVCKNPLEPVH